MTEISLYQSLSDLFTTPFLLRALLAMLIVAPLLALAGCLVVHSNLAFFSEALGHSALTGVALGTVLGLANQSAALSLTACGFAVIVSLLKHTTALSVDTVISLSMSFSVALGVAVLSHAGGFDAHSHILVGDLLTVTEEQVINALFVAIFAVVGLGLLWNGLTLSAVNASLARSRGVRVIGHDVLFSLLLALIVMLSVPWVGMLVVNSMLVLPAATARNLTASMRTYVWLSILVSILSSALGVLFSIMFDTATGATIVLVALGFFLVSLIKRVTIRYS